jgi:hypothetical protein
MYLSQCFVTGMKSTLRVELWLLASVINHGYFELSNQNINTSQIEFHYPYPKPINPTLSQLLAPKLIEQCVQSSHF